MSRSQLIESVAKAMWEETHTQDRPWRNKYDSNAGQIDRFLDMARIAVEMVERALERA